MDNRPAKTHITLPRRYNPTFHSINEFQVGEQLGEGATSEVFSAIHKKTGQKYAIKKITIANISPKDYENIEKELDIHRDLKCQYIVEMKDFFKENGVVYVILEHVPNGNVFKFLTTYNPLSDYHIGRIWTQTALAIEYLHDKDILMRDIKPENLVLDMNYNVKLCDFGWATKLSDYEYKKLKGGTFVYMAPETLRGEEQDKASDIWSLGVLLFELLHNREPYTEAGSCEEQLYYQNVQRIVFKKDISRDLSDLISLMLNKDRNQRPTIKDMLNGPFVKPYLQDIRTSNKMKLPEIDLSDKKKYEFDPNFKPYVISNGDGAPLPPGAKVTTKKNGIITTELIESTQNLPEDTVENTENPGQVKTVKKLIDSRPANPNQPLIPSEVNKYNALQINQTSAEGIGELTNFQVNKVENNPVSFNSKSIPDENLANNLLSRQEFPQARSFNNVSTAPQPSSNQLNVAQQSYKLNNQPTYQPVVKSYNNMQHHLQNRVFNSNQTNVTPVRNMNNNLNAQPLKSTKLTTVTNERKISHQKNRSYDPRAFTNISSNPLNEYAIQNNTARIGATTGQPVVRQHASNTVQSKFQVSSQTKLISHNRSKSKNRVIKLADYSQNSTNNVQNSLTSRGMTKNRSYNDLQSYHARLRELEEESKVSKTKVSNKIILN